MIQLNDPIKQRKYDDIPECEEDIPDLLIILVIM